ncbi:Golgi complex component 7-domain-containing protein [Russula earlei]|uniref:Golgi complex component 7-domain-containing protein n=1 Tax=Russula earlei TaxID=71964 RepID=A0ACC0TZY3_9AGAM|nr:Golgi complex component 7-domain-containing protein [Russula earlei]
MSPPLNSHPPDDFLLSLDDDIDIVSWINNLLQSDTPATSDIAILEKQLSHFVPALEVASEDLSLHIERLIDEISRSASRLPYDLQFMRDGALSLQAALNNLTTHSSSFSPQSSATLDRLHSLDTIKRNMQLARDVLREAESWSTLESEVSSLLSEQSYEKAAEKLSEANKSMVVFQNTPEYEARPSLSSALIAAINSHDATPCRAYYSIFANIQRDSEFRAYYFGSRRSSLVSMWQDAKLSDTTDAAGQFTPDFLNAFFTSFLAVLNSERASISAIFPDPQLTLSSFITSTLSALQPTFAERLSTFSDQLGPAALPELIAIFHVTERFAVAVDKVLERTEVSSAFVPPTTDSSSAEPTARTHRRRPSHARLSISRRMSVSASGIGPFQLAGSGLDWDTDVYEPFLEYQVSYGILESKFLFSSLPDPLPNESLSRMQSFTYGYGAATLVSSLDEFLTTFIDFSKDSFMSSSPASAASVMAGSDTEDLADLDYTLEDYSTIQLWLHILESLRGVRDRLSVFESQLRGTLLQTSVAFRARAQDPRATVPGTTRGALQLLLVSTLNSPSLHDLLDSINLPDGRLSSQDSGRLRGPSPLLTKAHTALNIAASLIQSSLQVAMLSPLYKSLASYASSPLWMTSDQAPRRPGIAGATSEAAVPTFSLSPSEAMQHAAEGLLNLPRLFEVYADDDVFAFSIETLPHVDAALLESFAEPAAAEQTSMHARRASSARGPPHSAAFSGLTPEVIASIWLSSLGLSFLQHLARNILPSIRSLTTAGAAQLASDLGYLGNIVSALSVESKELTRWIEVVGVDDETGRAMVLDVDGADSIFSSAARMRGWALAIQ